MGATQDQLIHDLIVVGAGVAGATAATLAADQGLQTVLIEQSEPAKKPPRRGDWLGEPATAMLDELGVKREGLLGEPFEGAVLYAADLRRRAETGPPKPPAFRVDYARLVAQLREHAASCGAKCVAGRPVQRVEAGEDLVTVVLADHQPVRARFVVMADGARGPQQGPGDQAWVAEASARVKPTVRDGQMHWVLGLDQGRSLGCWWFDKADVIVRLHGQGPRASVRGQLCGLIERVCERAGLPAAVASDIGEGEVRPAPAALALEIDSHVDKRLLRIGDAGGFLSAACREGIYPAIWSARLAVDVLAKAINSRHPQDELRRFSTLWRTTMGEYLRPPNTDMQFLLPLIFSNDQIAARMAAALWHGENI